MGMLLPDTSAWVGHLRQRSPVLSSLLISGEPIGYTEPVLMEVLMGARGDVEWYRLRRFITGVTIIPFESVADFESASWIFRQGRSVGVTVGKVDCLILAVARRSTSTLMTADQRQADLAEYVGIDVLRAA
ncbi:MAG: PIN domain-containing protein [Actinomycetales bacterium]